MATPTNPAINNDELDRIITRTYHAYIEKNNSIQPEEADDHNNGHDNDNDQNNDDDQVPQMHALQLPTLHPASQFPAPVAETKSMLTAPADEDKFWRIIATLAWANASDQKMGVRDIKRNITSDDITYIRNHIEYYASHVEDEISKLGWFASSTKTEIKNFTCHIVGLGEQYYLSAIVDPTGFVQFVWDTSPREYQDLYDFLHQI
jgi:hypothetical protein